MYGASLVDNVFCENALPIPPRWRLNTSHIVQLACRPHAIKVVPKAEADSSSMCIAGARVHESAGRLWPIAVRTGADVVSRFIRREGHWEIFDPNRLFKLANISSPTPPGTLLDIGSNLGFYSLAFAKAGWSVLAIEPMTQNRLALNLSLCANPDLAKRVRAIGVALGHPASQLNSSCVVRSYETRNVGDGVLTCGANARACGTTQATSASGGNNGLCENVRLMSLDALLSELRPQSIDAVKIGKTPKHCPCWPSPNLHPIRSPCFQLRAGHPLFLIRWFVDPCLCILTTCAVKIDVEVKRPSIALVGRHLICIPFEALVSNFERVTHSFSYDGLLTLAFVYSPLADYDYGGRVHKKCAAEF